MELQNSQPTPAPRGGLEYKDRVIEKIAGIATDNVDGVLPVSGGLGSLGDRMRRGRDKTKGIEAEVGHRQVALDLNVVSEYGRSIPELYDAMVSNIEGAVQKMTGLDVVEVNMHVTDVLSPEAFEALREKLGDDSLNRREYPAIEPTPPA